MADTVTAHRASQYQSTDHYDPTQAKPAVSAVLSSSASAFTEPSVDLAKPLTSTSNTAPETPIDTLSASAAPNSASERQSQSRSMSRASSAGSSRPEILTNQESKTTSPADAGGFKTAPSNGASVPSSLPSTVPVPVKSSNNVRPDSIVQGDGPSDYVSSHVQESAVETLDGATPQDSPVPSASQLKSPKQQAPASKTSLPKARLPHDKLGMLEDRIKEDPRGDTEAWLSLIDEHKKKGKLDEARGVYDRFLSLFPAAAEVWLSYAQMENDSDNRAGVDNVLSKSLMQVPSLPLWATYLDHVRRYNNTTTDASGQARQTIYQAYELALRQVGLDKDSGRMWQDYIAFIKSGPGIIGGSNWQDQQKMDLLRKTYQQAICVPTQATNALWKEYDSFEMGLNKMTGRKFLQDQSPGYMSARSSYTELQNITRELKRTTVPTLPPALGFDGDVEYMHQLNIWKRWIQWEKDDPLVLKHDDMDSYKSRVMFVYRHALMAMRFWPELWSDASEFCFANGMDIEGNNFLKGGIAANPESCLLAFKRADRIESAPSSEESDDKHSRRAAAVKEPYDNVLDTLYDLIAQSKTREELDIARIEAQFATANFEPHINGLKDESKDEDDEDAQEETKTKEKQKAEQIDATKSMHTVQTRLLSQTLSHVWIALMRAMRRIQGKGGVGSGGARGVFGDARKRGRITADVYVQAALIEFHCYEPDTGKKIFDRGLKLFQEDELFALEYIKHLVAINDHTNARVVFETVVTRLSQKPTNLAKAKPLYAFFHEFESRYGELTQITKLEKRMSDLFPEDPSLALFSKRFTDSGFDPTAIRPIISPAKQMRPKTIPSIQTTAAEIQTPQLQASNSPKRRLHLDEVDHDADRARKIQRVESPMKPITAPFMVQSNSQQQPQQQQQQRMPAQHIRPPMPQAPYPLPPLPRDITYLLSIIPKPETYHATKFDPKELVRLIRETHVPNDISQLPHNGAGRGMPAPGPPPQNYPPPHLAGPPQPYPQPGSVPPMQQRPGLPPMPHMQHMPPVGYPQYGQPQQPPPPQPQQQSAPYAYGR